MKTVSGTVFTGRHDSARRRQPPFDRSSRSSHAGCVTIRRWQTTKTVPDTVFSRAALDGGSTTARRTSPRRSLRAGSGSRRKRQYGHSPALALSLASALSLSTDREQKVHVAMPANQQDHEDWALQDWVGGRTVRLVDLTDKSAGGTAIKIAIATRSFLATAAHVISEGHDVRALVRGRKNEFADDFTGRGVDERHDVAFLELSNASAKLIGEHYVSKEEIVTDLDRSVPWACIVSGYPGQLIRTTDDVVSPDTVERVYDFEPVAHYSAMIGSDKWPREGFQRVIASDADLFVHFDGNSQLEYVKFRESYTRLAKTDLKPILDGISGGGIWLDSRPNAERIWYPRPLLGGIQTSYFPTDKCIRGTRIDRWLDLIAREQHELRDEIARIFDERCHSRLVASSPGEKPDARFCAGLTSSTTRGM